MTFDRLRQAIDQNEVHLVDSFLRSWDYFRDWRPAFAAFRAEVLDDLAEPDWANRLRDRLGLAQYDCSDGSVPVALMEYTVGEAAAAAQAAGSACFATAPTVVDSKPWPYFFPAPAGLTCGRAMALFEVENGEGLLAELLHFSDHIQTRPHCPLGLDRPAAARQRPEVVAQPSSDRDTDGVE
jgi:hypothetical protein